MAATESTQRDISKAMILKPIEEGGTSFIAKMDAWNKSLLKEVTSHVCKDEEFTQSIGLHLNELRSKQLLCDTTIEVDTDKFHVHRCVLAASSPYFQSMFTKEWAESKQDSVQLTGINQSGFEEILRFAYTGQAMLNSENFKDVLSSAHHFCYPSLFELCVKYMLDTMDEHNCLYYIKVAEMYDVPSVISAANNIVLNKFRIVSQSEEFLDISMDALCHFLLCDELHQNTKELRIFHAICTWVRHKPERVTLASKLMKHIRLHQLSTEELKEHVIQCEMVRQDKLCMDMVLASLLECRYVSVENIRVQNLPRPSTKEFKTKTNIQNTQTKGSCLYILDDAGTILAGKLNEQSNFDFHTIPSPSVDVAIYRGITFGDILFLVCNRASSSANGPSLLQFDFKTNRWQPMARIRHFRENYAMAALGDQLIVIGGKNESGLLSSAEQYNIKNDSWEQFPSLPSGRTNMSACVFKGSLYLCGGLTKGDIKCNDMYVYHPATMEGWMRLAPMPEKVLRSPMISLESSIYIFNGFHNLQCLVYKPDNDQWTRFSCEVVPCSPKSVAIYNDSIYSLGQCKDHHGTCLLRIAHSQGTLRFYCVCTLNNIKKAPRLC